MRRIRTIGGSVASTVAPPPSTLTAAEVVWGPNFGESTEFVVGGSLQSSVTALTTRSMTEEELIRVYQLQGTYSMATEASISRHIALAFPPPPVIQEQSVARDVIGMASANLTHEAALDRLNILDYRPVPLSTAEAVLLLVSQSPSYLDEQESLVRLAQITYDNVRTIQEGGITGEIELIFNGSGNFTVPEGSTAFTGECFGGGGGGGNGGTLQGGGGGGGGPYVMSTGISATPGTTVTVQVAGGSTNAAGETWIGSSATLMAKGGGRGGDNGTGGGSRGSTANSVGNLKLGGGNGAANSGSQGGGGGGGAGDADTGNSASSTAGAAGGAVGGGAGGDGGNATQPGDAGTARGGGGGGSGTLAQGGSGARGEARVTFALV